jgi:hypothetical protein
MNNIQRVHVTSYMDDVEAPRSFGERQLSKGSVYSRHRGKNFHEMQHYV